MAEQADATDSKPVVERRGGSIPPASTKVRKLLYLGMSRRTWLPLDLKNAVETSKSIREALGKLGLSPAGGNYKQFKEYVKELHLDITHFSGKGHLKGKTHTWGGKFDLLDILVENSTYRGGSYKLKKRLIKEGVLEDKCRVCCLSGTWRGKPIQLHLDHINGINTDNRLGNLQILCPNCHSQTRTYAGKNKRLKRPKV